jgi:polyphosphate glucokinase
MEILVVDVGGNNVKILASGRSERRKAPSGPEMGPGDMIEAVRNLTGDWPHEVVSLGYPGPVRDGAPVAEPVNLGSGWVGFDYEAAFGRPVRMVNDAAMQALGAYRGGRMLFLGLGTGLGSALVADGVLVPLELGHLPYRKERSYEDYLGSAGLKRRGLEKWERSVHDVAERLRAAFNAEDVVLGGGNVKKLRELPEGVRAGDNDDAFRGGFLLWEDGRSQDGRRPVSRKRG